MWESRFQMFHCNRLPTDICSWKDDLSMYAWIHFVPESNTKKLKASVNYNKMFCLTFYNVKKWIGTCSMYVLMSLFTVNILIHVLLSFAFRIWSERCHNIPRWLPDNRKLSNQTDKILISTDVRKTTTWLMGDN